MTVFSLVYTLHVLAALIWVGGMFFAWMILRPAAVKAHRACRLGLSVNVFQRFFVWVWVANTGFADQPALACCTCASAAGSRPHRAMCR